MTAVRAEPVAGPGEPKGTSGVPGPIRRLRTWIAGTGLVALAFSQQPGLIVGDTKADLVLDPGTFLARALHAWDPQQAFGQLQNQAYGYLWPMGPFFWLGHALHLPAWVVQRAWWSALLLVAFAGLLRLSGALRIGSPNSRLVAAVAYACCPRVLSVLGSISVEALPLAVLPWILLPLVRAAGGGLSPRRGAALSGLALVCAGGVNAAATLAVLPLPALYLLTRPPGPARRRLIGWWALAVPLAIAWWALPLVVLGRYAYPFLDQIETAGVTTQVTTAANALRGTSHWLAYLILHGSPRWPAGFDLAVSPLPVIGTALLAAGGLAGLLLSRPQYEPDSADPGRTPAAAAVRPDPADPADPGRIPAAAAVRPDPADPADPARIAAAAAVPPDPADPAPAAVRSDADSRRGARAGSLAAERRWLLLGVLIGTVVIAIGHVGTLTSPLAPAVDRLLDGPLAPFRNVHKFDPVLRLPLALGLAHLLAVAARAATWGWLGHLRPSAAASRPRPPDPAGNGAAATEAGGQLGDTARPAAVEGASRTAALPHADPGPVPGGPPGATAPLAAVEDASRTAAPPRAGTGPAPGGGWLARLRPGVAAGAVVLIGLAATAVPAWGGRLAPDGGYPGLPGYWRAAAGWLADHAEADHGRALLLPSSNFADYQWGSPQDEPLQALARSPWAVRDAVPLGAPGATRLLDALDARLSTGEPWPALAEVLARMGVRYVLLRNDLDVLRAGSERPAVIRAALAGSPGISPAASFGPALRTGLSALDTTVGDPGTAPGLPADARRGPPAIEIFAVASGADPATAATYPQAGAVALTGGPEGVLDLADDGLLTGRAVVAAPDLPASASPAGAGDASPAGTSPAGTSPAGTSPSSSAAAPSLVGGVVGTDTYRRRSLNFGADPDRRYSPTLTAADDPAPGRPAGDVPPYPTVDGDEQSVGVLAGATAVTASSSAADPFAAAYRGPDRRPAAAFDGDPSTAWVSDADPVGQWVELTLPRPVNLDAVTVSLVDDPAVGPAITRLAVTTDAGTVTSPVATTSDPQRVPVPLGATTRLRLTVAAVTDRSGGGAAGISEVTVPGVTVTEGVALPAATVTLQRSGLPWTVLVSRAAGRRGDCVRPDVSRPDRPWECVAGLAAAGEEVTGLDRRFGTATAGPVSVRVTVRARRGDALDAVLDRALGYRATGSSTFSSDPVARPGAAYDGDPATAWIPAGSDAMPQLRLDLGSTVTLRGLRLAGTAADYAGVAGIVLAAGNQRRTLTATPGRDQFFAPLPARELTVTLLRKADKDGRLAPVRVPDLLLGGAPRRAAGTVTLPCGEGPALGLDGAVIQTAVTATVADLTSLAPVPAQTCTAPVRLAAGQHRLVTALAADQPVEVAGATLAGGRPLPAPAAARPVTVLAWAAESRRLQVAAGPAGFVALTEGFNAGWKATVDGRALVPIRLDGWRQAWLLPASAGPVRITVSYPPGRWHRAGLLLGLLAVLALLALALARPGAPPSHGDPAPGRTGRPILALARPGAPPSHGEPAPGPTGRPIVAGVLAAGVPLLLAGVAGLVPAAVAVLLPPRWRATVAAGCLAAAGLVLGLAPNAAAQPAAVQLLSVTALAVTAAALAPGPDPLLPIRPPRSPPT